MKISFYDLLRAAIKKLFKKTSKTKFIHSFIYDWDFLLYCKAVANNAAMGRHIVETSGRGSGKTTRALYISAYSGKPILTRNQMQADILKTQAREMGLLIPDPFSWGSSPEKVKGSSSLRCAQAKGLIVDEAQNILDEILRSRYKTGTNNFYIFGERKVTNWLRELKAAEKAQKQNLPYEAFYYGVDFGSGKDMTSFDSDRGTRNE